jgi:hypothetical protein
MIKASRLQRLPTTSKGSTRPMANTLVIDGFPKMDPARKAEWLTALRSGEYKQGHEWLNREGNMCCLGVACDLHSKSPEGLKWKDTPTTNILSYDRQTSYPPEEVLAWLGFELADLRTPDLVQQELQANLSMSPGNTGMVHYVLANLNDSERWSFDQIADFIEANF